jgi:hypothetical protein
MPKTSEAQRKARARWYQRNKQFRKKLDRDRGILRKYGLTPEQYDQKYYEQNGRCAICSRHQSESKRNFHIDHDHLTGKVRALLCGVCNPRLGIIENKDFVEKAMEYLKYHQTQDKQMMKDK